MSIKKKCTSCGTEYEIIENSVLAIPKQVEKAYCPDCNQELYSKTISGWYYVSKIEKKEKEKDSCIYPMS